MAVSVGKFWIKKQKELPKSSFFFRNLIVCVCRQVVLLKKKLFAVFFKIHFWVLRTLIVYILISLTFFTNWTADITDVVIGRQISPLLERVKSEAANRRAFISNNEEKQGQTILSLLTFPVIWYNCEVFVWYSLIPLNDTLIPLALYH